MTAISPPMSDPTAVMGRRIAAFIVDYLLMLLLVGAVAYPVWHDNARTTTMPTKTMATEACNRISDRGDVCFVSGERDIVFISRAEYRKVVSRSVGMFSLFVLVDLILLPSLTGAGVGKLLLGLRVVNGSDGQQAGVAKHLIRGIVGIVDVICCFLPGLISALTSKGHRRIGDMAAGTNVVPKDQVGRPPAGATVMAGQGQTWGMPPTSVPPPGWAPPSSAPPASWAPTPGVAGPGAPGATASGDGPRWDEARNAYIQYDQAQGAWLQWDDATQAWKPIAQ